jgi:hypothetical protein
VTIPKGGVIWSGIRIPSGVMGAELKSPVSLWKRNNYSFVVTGARVVRNASVESKTWNIPRIHNQQLISITLCHNKKGWRYDPAVKYPALLMINKLRN